MITIALRGIHASGRHGATPGERDAAQEFVVDLDVDVDPSSDELSATADYREIVRVTRQVVEDESFVLLETMARQVATSVEQLAGVGRVRVVVHKPGAAMRLGIDDVAAEAVVG